MENATKEKTAAALAPATTRRFWDSGRCPRHKHALAASKMLGDLTARTSARARRTERASMDVLETELVNAPTSGGLAQIVMSVIRRKSQRAAPRSSLARLIVAEMAFASVLLHLLLLRRQQVSANASQTSLDQDAKSFVKECSTTPPSSGKMFPVMRDRHATMARPATEPASNLAAATLMVRIALLASSGIGATTQLQAAPAFALEVFPRLATTAERAIRKAESANVLVVMEERIAMSLAPSVPTGFPALAAVCVRRRHQHASASKTQRREDFGTEPRATGATMITVELPAPSNAPF